MLTAERIIKLKQKTLLFSDSDNTNIWCKLFIQIMWLTNSDNKKYYKLIINAYYPSHYSSGSIEFKKSLQKHPLYNITKNKDIDADIDIDIDIDDIKIMIVETTETTNGINRLLQSNSNMTNNPDIIKNLYHSQSDKL